MKRLIFALLILSVFGASAAIQTINPPPFGTTVRIVESGASSTSLSNLFWTIPNNSEIHIAPGNYSVPLLGSHIDNCPPALVLPNKTNVTIYGYGAILSNTTPTVAGHMLYLSNFNNIKILGLEFAGGGIVDSNTGFPSLMVLDRSGIDLTIFQCKFRDSVKAIKAWTNTPSFTGLNYLYSHFSRLGDTNHPGVGGGSQDGSCIEAWGRRCRAVGNFFEYYVNGIELFNQPNETLFSDIVISDNRFENSLLGDDIVMLEGSAGHAVVDILIENNTFTNAPGVRITGASGFAHIRVKGPDVTGAQIVNNDASGSSIAGGESVDFLYVSPGSVSRSTIEGNKVRVGKLNGVRMDSDAPCNYNVIARNIMDSLDWRAFWIEGSGNTITENLVRNANVNADGGFFLESACFIGPDGSAAVATNNNIFGNSFIDDQGSATTRSGIEFGASANANYVGHNYYSRVMTNVYNLGANNRISSRPVLEGTATLSSGLATVNTVWVHANSRIILTPRATANAVSALTVTNVVNGTSFQVRSASNSDGNRVDYLLMEPQ